MLSARSFRGSGAGGSGWPGAGAGPDEERWSRRRRWRCWSRRRRRILGVGPRLWRGLFRRGGRRPGRFGRELTWLRPGCRTRRQPRYRTRRQPRYRTRRQPRYPTRRQPRYPTRRQPRHRARWLLPLLRNRHDINHRPDEQPGGLPEVACLVAVATRDGDDQVVAVDDDLRARHTEAVDAGTDDLLCLVERLAGGPGTIGGARRQRHPGAALKVDAELRLGLLVAGEEHQQVQADQKNQEHRQVPGRAHRRATMPRSSVLLALDSSTPAERTCCRGALSRW